MTFSLCIYAIYVVNDFEQSSRFSYCNHHGVLLYLSEHLHLCFGSSFSNNPFSSPSSIIIKSAFFPLSLHARKLKPKPFYTNRSKLRVLAVHPHTEIGTICTDVHWQYWNYFQNIHTQKLSNAGYFWKIPFGCQLAATPCQMYMYIFRTNVHNVHKHVQYVRWTYVICTYVHVYILCTYVHIVLIMYNMYVVTYVHRYILYVQFPFGTICTYVHMYTCT